MTLQRRRIPFYTSLRRMFTVKQSRVHLLQERATVSARKKPERAARSNSNAADRGGKRQVWAGSRTQS